MLNDPNSETSDLVAEARTHLAAIEADLPTLLEGLQFSCPYSFRAASLRELLRHRVSDLAQSAIPLLEQGRVVPAAILSRAIAETVALLFSLHYEVSAFLLQPDEQRIDSFLKAALVGSRNPEHPIQATNILTAIKKLDNEIPAFRLSYDTLSEFAHPNWSGVLGAYGKVDYEEWSLALGDRDNSNGIRTAAFVTASVLSTFCHYYDLLADVLRQFDAHYRDIEESSGGA